MPQETQAVSPKIDHFDVESTDRNEVKLTWKASHVGGDAVYIYESTGCHAAYCALKPQQRHSLSVRVHEPGLCRGRHDIQGFHIFGDLLLAALCGKYPIGPG
jgi:hypothetical protein